MSCGVSSKRHEQTHAGGTAPLRPAWGTSAGVAVIALPQEHFQLNHKHGDDEQRNSTKKHQCMCDTTTAQAETLYGAAVRQLLAYLQHGPHHANALQHDQPGLLSTCGQGRQGLSSSLRPAAASRHPCQQLLQRQGSSAGQRGCCRCCVWGTVLL